MVGLQRVFFVAVIASLAGFACAPTAARAGARASALKKPYVPSQCIVVPAPGISIDEINARYGSTTIDRVGDAYLLRLPQSVNVTRAVQALRTDL